MSMLNPAEQTNVLPTGMIQPGLVPVPGQPGLQSDQPPQGSPQYPATSPASLPSGLEFPGYGNPVGPPSQNGAVSMQNPGSMNGPAQTPDQLQQMTPADMEAIRQRVGTQLNRMLMFRRPYDPLRLRWFKEYIQVRDQRMFPDNVTPRSNTVVPYAASNVETVVSRTDDAFFSVMPFFECTARASQNPLSADAMQIILEYKLHRSKLPAYLETFTRNCAIYGHGGLKVDWDWGYDILNYAVQVPVMRPAVDQYGERVIGPDGKPAQ